MSPVKRRSDGTGGEWSEQKTVRRRHPETGKWVKTDETRTIWKVSRRIPWTHRDDTGVEREGVKVLVAEGSTPRIAHANLEKRIARFKEVRNPAAPLREQRATETLSEYFWDAWTKSKRHFEYRPNTARGHLTRMRLHVLPVLGDKRLVDLSRDDVRRLFEKVMPEKTIEKGKSKGQKYGPEQTRDIWKTLHIVLQDAVYDGKIPRNPMDDIRDTDKPKRGAATTLLIPDGIVIDLTRTLRRPEWEVEQVRFNLALQTGIRGGEALGITWDRISGVTDGDSRQPRLVISQQLARMDIKHGPGCKSGKDGQWACGVQARYCPRHDAPPTPRIEIVKWTKSKKERSLPLTRRMRELLRTQFERQLEWKRKYPGEWAQQEALRDDLSKLVFTTEKGKPFRPQSDGKRWHELLVAAGHADFDGSAHKTRHLAVSALALQGVSLELIGEIVGHSNAEITRIYRHIQQSDIERHLEALDDHYEAVEAAREAAREEWVNEQLWGPRTG
jgi:integrase